MSMKDKLPKLDGIILKNETDKKTLFYIKNKKGFSEAERLTTQISTMFDGSPDKKLEDMTPKEFKKYKRRKKNLSAYQIKNIDSKKTIKFIVIFLAIAFVGAIFSWIYLGSKNVNASSFLQSQVECDVTTSVGDFNGSEIEMLQLENFTKSKPKDADIKLFNELIFKIEKTAKSINLQSMSFSIKFKGRGIVTYDITLFDAKTNKTKELAKNKEQFFEDGDKENFSFNVGHNFTDMNENSYIKLTINADRTQGLNGFAFYNLDFKKY